MLSFIMKTFRFRKLFHFIKYKPIETSIVISIILATILPLRCPTWRGYAYLNYNEIKDDLQMCLVTRRPHDFKLCPLVSPDLASHKHANKVVNETLLREMPEKLNILPGGRWFPKHCSAWQRVAIIIPYRDRKKHLDIFLQNMHPFLQAQQLDYGIFVIEQSEKHKFNRGKLFNIGYLEATKEPDFCCFIFHDVDLLPESPRHTYGCSEEPRHMCSALDTFRYVLPYPELFGGVVAFTKEQFSTVNGYSNLFFGWGGEDDDLYDRLKAKQINVRRWAPEISRFTMLFHKKETPNQHRFLLLKTVKERMDRDGLNTLDYKILSIDSLPLYTRILVDVKPK
ncbi:beta-1,4-galactosyltransferase 4-like isoform X1 [Argiope bruennichi]|uniref:beta-1,4-galactosyltransferase 4-like isoform X1 n=1 Tax=Argiope bruennichi TaxID=94029 RepID=UPI002494515F|nr:beta-1,4-galactosyltransferase 4-like isoform X1 [Argiope bruennichi]